MTRFAVAVEVSLRPGIADPQGATIERSLPVLGFAGIDGVRTGKAIRFHIEADSQAQAQAQVERLCRTFLTNPVIEDAAITFEDLGTEDPGTEGPVTEGSGGLG